MTDWQEGDAVYWARIYALFYVVGGALTVLTAATTTTPLLPVAAGGALAAIGLAFILRIDRARVFLAGLHALLTLGGVALTITCAIDQGPQGLLLFLFFAPVVAGAFLYVSPKVRRYTGSP